MSQPTNHHDPSAQVTGLSPVRIDAGAPGVTPEGSMLRCRTIGGWWLVDPVARRLCRSTERLDPIFVADGYWETFRGVTIGPDWAVAELADGLVVRAATSEPGVGSGVEVASSP